MTRTEPQATDPDALQLAREIRGLRWLERVLIVTAPLFAIADVGLAHATGRASVVPALFATRGLAIAVVLAHHLLASDAVRARHLRAGDYGLAGIVGAAVGARALLLGGTDGQLMMGIAVSAAVRMALVPSPFGVLLRWGAACLGAFFVAIGAGWWLFEGLRPASAPALGLFGAVLLQVTVMVCAAGFASHLAYRALQEAAHAHHLVHRERNLQSYRLKMRIGGGACGEVWLARQARLGRDVALKVLKSAANLDAKAIRRFEREGQALSRLRHPHTVQVFDFGATDDGVIFLAMELLDGMDLDALVERSGPLPAARVIHFARQACGSLTEAHEAGIVHRDVKPANLFVTHVGDETDFLKVVDFGVARVATRHSLEVTGKRAVVGTPMFMAPEICRGEVADARSDVYSLGVVLYFMLTGTMMFRELSFAALVRAHVEAAPESPSSRLGAAVPASLEQVVLRCVAKAPGDRFQTMRALDAALAACDDVGRWNDEDAKRSWRAILGRSAHSAAPAPQTVTL